MLELKNICHSYLNKDNKKLLVFDNFDLKIEEERISVIVGPSGCGKTTLVNIIAGYVQPISGEVILKNKKIKYPSNDRIIINQENDIFEWLTVYENIKLVTKNESAIEKYLKLTNLYEFKNSYPRELSGGMKKRLSLARALAVNPDFIIMDEPFVSLDQNIKETLHEELLLIFKKSKKTLLLITHDIEEAVYLADDIYIFSHPPVKIISKIKNTFSKNTEHMSKVQSEFVNTKKQIEQILKENSFKE